MKINNSLIKQYLSNVYFINGTAYAGKSTVCKQLAKKYNMFHCEENYKFDAFLELTTPTTHPHMNYFKTMNSWEEFVTRSKYEYEAWLDGVAEETAEFEIIELISLSKNQKVIVDTNIPHDILKQISDPEHVLYMVATPEISMEEFFKRDDPEKQFILSVINKTKDPKSTLKQYEDSIAYINRQERIDFFKNSGFPVIERKAIDESVEDKVRLAEKYFKLDQ